MKPAEVAQLALIREKVRHAGECSKALLSAAKLALQELRQDSGRRTADDQPFLEVIAELQRAVDKAEGRVE